MTLDPGVGIAVGRRVRFKSIRRASASPSQLGGAAARQALTQLERVGQPRLAGWQKGDESGPLPSRCARAFVCINDALQNHWIGWHQSGSTL
jgi:hypothetical protein